MPPPGASERNQCVAAAKLRGQTFDSEKLNFFFFFFFLNVPFGEWFEL